MIAEPPAPAEKTQAEMILAALRRGERITPKFAFDEFGCMRLAPRILELRQSGVNIETQMVEVGRGKRVAAYFIPAAGESTKGEQLALL